MGGRLSNSLVVLIFFVVISFSGCTGCKEKLPALSTKPVEQITATTAESGGRIISKGRSEILSAGICWDTIHNPIIAGPTWTDSAINNDFTAHIKDLLPKTTYYARAFATNSFGTTYGEELSFTTLPSVPLLTTARLSEVLPTSLKAGGKFISNGGSEITEQGICWDTLAGPDISDSHIADVSSSVEFECTASGLFPDKRYYIRSYATNSLGTGYGEERAVVTPLLEPLVSRFTISERWLYSAAFNVLKVELEGNPVSGYGVCWGTDPDPDIDNFSTTKQFEPGRLRMTKLKPATRYYARLFYTDEKGTHYGKQGSWTSLGRLPRAETLSSSDRTVTGAKVKAVVNSGFTPTIVTFEYGPDDNYGQSVKLDPFRYPGWLDTTIIAEITNLKGGVNYHYRVSASNDLGTVYGKDETIMLLSKPSLKGFSPIYKNYHDSVHFLTPPVSNSKGEITYTSGNPKIARIEGNKIIITGSGTCTITANQAPEGEYDSGSISTTFSMNVVDIDGNVYHTVTIGDQDWIKENLMVTRYRNGDPIPEVKENDSWVTLTTGAFSWFKSDSAKGQPVYGALYNWYAVSDPRRICPDGWHVPTDAEWQVMERFLGMTFAEAEETVNRGKDQGIQLKDSIGWIKNGNGKNSSEFSGRPGGLRLAESGDFHNLGADACWWTASFDDDKNAWMRNMYYYLPGIYRIPDLKTSGFSVRCVRDRKMK